MPSLGWQELTIVLVLALWVVAPLVFVVRTALRKGGYTPWLAIVVMIIGGYFNPLLAFVWWIAKGRTLGQSSIHGRDIR